MGKKRGKSKEEKVRWFVITIWDVDMDLQEIIDAGQVRYIAYGHEVCPESGRPHLQAFVYFHNLKGVGKTSLNRIGNLFGKKKHARVKPMYGSIAENEAYCSKESRLIKLGNEPKQGTRVDIDEVVDILQNGLMTVDDICMVNPAFVHQYGRTLDRLEGILLRKKYRSWMTKGFWYTGPSGAGKSHRVFEGYDPDTHYVKNLNEDWWDGYKGQEIVIFNEFRGQITMSELLDLCDKWPKTVKWRSREPVPFLAKEIRIASIKKPQHCYSGLMHDEPWEQFERRFEVIEIEQKCSEGNIRPLSDLERLLMSEDSD